MDGHDKSGDGVAVVLGAGGHAKVIISTLQLAGISVAGIYDDDLSKKGERVLGVQVLGSPAEIAAGAHQMFVVGIGNNAIRRQVVERLPKLAWLKAVHPKAYVHETVQLGEGTVVFAGAVIQPHVRIGRHVIINTGATIDHDCVIEDFAHIAPGCNLAGGVSVRNGAFMGIGSAAVPGVDIGEWTTVGAGGVVVKSLPAHVTAIGVPARPVCFHPFK